MSKVPATSPFQAVPEDRTREAEAMIRPKIFIYFWCVLTLFLLVGSAAPQSSDNVIPTIAASYRTGEVRIDGRVTEDAWGKAIPATRFLQGQPVEGAAAQERTEVRVLYDEAALYVGAFLYDRMPERIGHQLVRRDERGAYDYFEVSLDPNNDRLTGFTFRVSAAGVQGDMYLFNDVRTDVAWDAVWSSAVHRDSSGWSTEIRIPLSQLRYNASDSLQSWGVNFSRRRLAENEVTYFALESRLQRGKVSVFGRLTGLKLAHRSRRFEVKPYTLANTNLGPAEVNNPLFDGSEFSTQTGVDISYGLGSDYNLDVTINPDFGQVEVDPAVINLTEFETFFPEKRPFFVRDAQLFVFDLSGRRNQLFYSRRIGRQPQGDAPEAADFDDIPTQTTILSAAKLTGRSASGLSLGALAALTSETKGRAFFDSTGTVARFPVEPRSLYSVVRARQDFREGTSQIGAIVTLMHRDLPADGTLDFLAASTYGVGADFEFNWGGPRSRNWALLGHAVGTYIKGPATAITEIQTSSTHYFQRPDAQRFSLDSTVTSMRGLEWQLQFQRRSGQHWTGSVWVNERTPGFEINDLGFLSSGEGVSGGTRITYREIKPGSLFRSYRIRLFAVHDWRHRVFNDFSWQSAKNAYDGGRWSLNSELEFLNYWRLELELNLSPEYLSDTATRGGPLMTEPGKAGISIRGSTDRRRKLHFRPRFDYRDGLRGGYEWRTQLAATFRPSAGWEIYLQPGFSQELDPGQYVETTGVLDYAATFGNRYIFGELKQNSFSIESRLNVTLNPKLTIQLYAQQLISSGKYGAYKQLLRPESFDFDVLEEGSALVQEGSISCLGGRTCVHNEERYIDFDGDGNIDFSFSDENFNVRSLKLNTVLRWEYRPGSTLFLVWQHTRLSKENMGSFDLGNSINRLWQTEPNNAVILKLNYWFDL